MPDPSACIPVMSQLMCTSCLEFFASGEHGDSIMYCRPSAMVLIVAICVQGVRQHQGTGSVLWPWVARLRVDQPFRKEQGSRETKTHRAILIDAGAH